MDGVVGGCRVGDAGQHTAEAAGPGWPLHAGHRCGRGEKSILFCCESLVSTATCLRRPRDFEPHSIKTFVDIYGLTGDFTGACKHSCFIKSAELQQFKLGRKKHAKNM